MRRSIHIRTGVTKPGKKDAALCKTSRIFINLIPAVKVAVNPHFHDVLAGILVPFLKNVVRNLVFQTKQLEGTCHGARTLSETESKNLSKSSLLYIIKIFSLQQRQIF